MTRLTGISIAVVIGLVGTSVVHVSKGVMKEGISRRRSGIYSLGVALNFTAPIWVIFANRFAPTVYYTSVYGLGLAALVVYGRVRLHERVGWRQLAALGLIVAGTLVIGASELSDIQPSLHNASREQLILFATVWIVLTPFLAVVFRKAGIHLQETLFGISGGGFAAFDAITKGVAQAEEHGSTLLPTDTSAWVLFVLSFIGAAGAFAMIQWSYLRSCRASMMAAAYDVAYVAIPLLVVPMLTGDAMIGLWCVVGLGLLAVGAGIAATSASTASTDSVGVTTKAEPQAPVAP